MVSYRRKAAGLDEAFVAAEDMSIIEQMGSDDFVHTMIIERNRNPSPQADGELGEISTLLSSLLMDSRSLRPRDSNITAGGVRGPRQRHRRVLAR